MFEIFLITLLGRLPLQVRRFLGRIVGSCVALFPTRDRRVAELQSTLFLPTRRSVDVSAMFANLGETLMESINLKPFLANSERWIQCDNWDLVLSLLKRGKGTLALTAHCGNWDLMAAYFIARGIPLTTVGRKARKHSWQNVLDSIRNGYGIRTIWRSDRRGLRELGEALDSSGVVAALIDQDTKTTSHFSPFFGHPARTPSLLVSMALKRNAIIVTAFCRRLPNGCFSIDVAEIDARSSLEAVLNEYHARLERHVVIDPAQWVWFHKRWRSTPTVRRSAAEYLCFLEESLQCRS